MRGALPPPTMWSFVHLYDPESEQIVAQSDARPLKGTYPTNAWRAGEVISDEIVLDLGDVPAGAYRLAMGMVGGEQHRIGPTIVTATGEIVPDGPVDLGGQDRAESEVREVTQRFTETLCPARKRCLDYSVILRVPLCSSIRAHRGCGRIQSSAAGRRFVRRAPGRARGRRRGRPGRCRL